MEGEKLACPNCRAEPVVQIAGTDAEFQGMYAVETTVHAFENSEYEPREKVLVVYCPHCMTVLGVIRAN